LRIELETEKRRKTRPTRVGTSVVELKNQLEREDKKI
jgi:hypothetical protein